MVFNGLVLSQLYCNGLSLLNFLIVTVSLFLMKQYTLEIINVRPEASIFSSVFHFTGLFAKTRFFIKRFEIFRDGVQFLVDLIERNMQCLLY